MIFHRALQSVDSINFLKKLGFRLISKLETPRQMANLYTLTNHLIRCQVGFMKNGATTNSVGLNFVRYTITHTI